MDSRKISIITPSLNRMNMLECVIQNVIVQRHPNFEYIVVDSCSIDGTQDMVERYPHVGFICALENGLYNAVQKGFERSSGEIMGYLNFDDLFFPWTLQVAGQIFVTFPQKESRVYQKSLEWRNYHEQ